MTVEDAAPLFAALGDATRLALVMRLSKAGPASVTGLSAEAHVSRQAISKHLGVLSGVGLVRSERRGRERIWAIEPERLVTAREYIERIDAEWDSALERLRSMVEDG